MPQPPPPWGPGPAPPPPRQRNGWVFGGIAAFVVALVASAGVVIVATSDGEKDTSTPPATTTPSETEVPSSAPSSTSPIPTGSFSDGLTTGGPTATPTEQRRTLRDVDRGMLVYDDVYVQPAAGWRRVQKRKQAIVLGTTQRIGIVIVMVDPFGYEASKGLPRIVDQLIKSDGMVGVRKAPVRTLRPANANISSQAQMAFSGRVRIQGVTLSLTALCTTMTGVESIHNVAVTLCAWARRDDPEQTFRDSKKMLDSVARSI